MQLRYGSKLKNMKKIRLSTFEIFKNLHTSDAVVINDDELRQMQKMLFEMMKDIIQVCEENDFYYVLGGGSAIGAVRHQGFIPWDDDVDINMKRKDIIPFIDVMKSRFADKYWIRTPWETENYGLVFIQIRKKGTSVRTRDDYWNEECGLSIDIFPIENTYDSRLMRMIHGAGCYYYGFGVSCRKFYRDRKWLMSLAADDNALKLTFRLKIALGFLCSYRSLDDWVRKADRWYSRCHDENSEYIVFPSGRIHFKELYPRDLICKKKDMLFNGIKAACPVGIDTYLKTLYGDYMRIPEKGNEQQHVYYKPFYL